MNKDVKISVAIGTWNRVDMVRQAIEAALNQTLKPFEIIVFDDASPDHTYDLLSKEYLNHSIVKVFKQKKNTGGVPNWNAAINACSGDYIAWCSDDDRWFKWHLENAVNYLEKNKEIGMVHSAFCDCYEDEHNVLEYHEINEEVLQKNEHQPFRSSEPIMINSKSILDYYLKYYNWPFHPSTLVFRKIVWLAGGEFNPKYELADTDWFLKIGSNFDISLLPYYGVLNRRHNGNWSNAMGGVNMQKEQYLMVKAFLNENNHFSKNRKYLLRIKWKFFFQQLVFRMYFSRSRYGYFESSQEAALFLRSISLLKILPEKSFKIISKRGFKIINFLNSKLSNGFNKGENLGKFVPK